MTVISGTTDGHFSRTTNVPTGAAAFSWCAWIRIVSNQTTADGCVWGVGLDGTHFIVFKVPVGTTNLTVTDGSHGLITTLTPTAAVWLFVGYTHSSGTAHLYTRTEAAGSLTDSGALTVQDPASTWQLVIFNDGSGERAKTTEMIAYKQWNGAALSSTEMLAESKHFALQRSANVDSVLPFTSVSGTDTSGNGRNWTVNGTPLTAQSVPLIETTASSAGSGTLAANANRLSVVGAGAFAANANFGAMTGLGAFAANANKSSILGAGAFAANANKGSLLGAGAFAANAVFGASIGTGQLAANANRSAMAGIGSLSANMSGGSGGGGGSSPKYRARSRFRDLQRRFGKCS